MMKYNAVILAGGTSNWLRNIAGTNILCLAKLAGETVLHKLVAALQSSDCIKEIVITAPHHALEKITETAHPLNIKVCPSGSSVATTALAGIRALGASSEERILFVCDDIPLISGEAVADFIKQCEAYPQDEIFYPIIGKDICLEEFPEAERTFVTLAHGKYTGGNMMFISAAAVIAGQNKAEEIYCRRKHPWKLCKWLGWGFIFKAWLGRLTAEEISQRCSELMGLRCRVITSTYPSVGMDIDKPCDWKLMCSYYRKSNVLDRGGNQL